MANDDRQSEQFIREVDEELRRAQMKAIWDRFAPLIIGVCVLVVLLTAGYRGWLWWQARQAAEDGDRFMAALEQVETGDRDEGLAALQAIAAEGGRGYAVLAQMRLAGARAAAGEAAEAIAAYDGVAADEDAPESMRDVARIRAALLALDTGDLEGATSRAEPLEVAGNPWRHAAREILGTADYERGQLESARDTFLEIQQDAETPPDLWLRAGMMVQLIDGQLATPGSVAPDAAAAEQGPAPAETPQAGAAPTETGYSPGDVPPAVPAAEVPTLDIPTLDLPVLERPALDLSAPEVPAPETPTLDAPAPDAPVTPESPEDAGPTETEAPPSEAVAPDLMTPAPPVPATADESVPPVIAPPAPSAAPDTLDQASDAPPAEPGTETDSAPQTVIPPQ